MVFGWGPDALERMTFHELVMVWFPRAVELHRSTEESRNAGLMLGMLKGMSRGW